MSRAADQVLLVKGISGLGDRMLCALTGVLYARLSGRRLVVDWRDDAYATGGVNSFHHYFLSPFCSPLDDVPETDSVAPQIWRGRLHESAAALRERFGSLSDAQGWRAFSIDLTRLDYRERIAVLWTYGAEVRALAPPVNAVGGDAAANEDALLRELLHASLSLRPRIRERIDRFRNEHFGQRTVGVHVRFTDHRTALGATLRALDSVLRADPSCSIFLATDNLKVAEVFAVRYGRVLRTERRHASAPGRVLHYGPGRPDALQMGEEALVDLYLLAACDDLIVDTSSSFARVAMLLSDAPAGRRVDVKRRDKLPPRVRHMSNRIMRRFRVYSWGPALIARFAGGNGAVRRALREQAEA